MREGHLATFSWCSRVEESQVTAGLSLMRSRAVSKGKIRILIADREGVFRLGLKKLLSVEDDLRVVAQAETAAQAIGLAKKFKPHLLFVQSEIAAESPQDFFSQVRHSCPGAKILVTASNLGDEEALRYVKSGASGVVLKTVDPELFIRSARKVMQNEIWLPKPQVAKMAKLFEEAKPAPARPADTLTRREKTIISFLMLGMRNREIAEQLSITEQTVKNYLRSIYDKVGVSDRLELVLYAIHQRLVLPEVAVSASSPRQRPSYAGAHPS